MGNQLRLDVVDPDADPQQLDEITGRLREALLQLDVNDVERAPDAVGPPEGAKSAGAVAAGSLIVSMATTPGLLASVLETIRGWLGLRGSRSVKLTLGGDSIEVSGISDQAQEDLVRSWLAKHAPATS
jgi:hypothetical protein